MAAQQPAAEPLAPEMASGYIPQLLPPREVPVNKGWEIAKLALHGTAAVSSIIAVGISASFIGRSGDNDGDLFEIGLVGLFPPLIALIWDLAELITRAIRKWKAGIHPGAHVGLSLIIWLIALFLGGNLSLLAWIKRVHSSCRDDLPPQKQDRWQDYCPDEDDIEENLALLTALAVFVVLVGVFHLVLFIGACVDTHRHRRAHAYSVIMVAHPQLATGWQPVQDQRRGEAVAESQAERGSAA